MITNSAYAASLEQTAARQERQRVELVLREFGLQDWRAKVFDEHYVLTGDRKLSFRAFDRVFPGFPVCLESLPLYRLGTHTRCSQTAMFRNFRDYVPFRQFLDIREWLWTLSSGRPIGILYRWPGIRHGLILHDGEFATAGFKQTFVEGSVRVTIEHFRRLLQTLAASDISVESLRSDTEPDVARKARLRLSPWTLARHCESEPELRLLAFLVEILFHMPPAAGKRYIVRVDGQRWISITEGQLAQRIGTSVRTIQRAIASLRDGRIIETQRDRYGKNQIRVCTTRFR